MRYKAALTSVVLLAGLTSACFPNDPGTPPSTTTTTAVPTTLPPNPVTNIAPLTGLDTGSTVDLDRPALVVKIDNTTTDIPPAGINQADVVFESLTEAGMTRFTAVFHSKNAAQVGPVRSVRSRDLDLTASVRKPLFANSGANDGVTAITDAWPFLSNLDEPTHPALYTRSGPNPAPYNLFSSTAALYGATPAGSQPPSSPFAFLATGQANPSLVASAGANLRFTAPGFGPATLFTWTYDTVSGRYLRTVGFGDPHVGTSPAVHVDTTGQQLWTNNVVILQTGQDAAYGGLSARSVGFGTGYVLNNRTVVAVNWKRDTATSPFVLTAVNGGGTVKLKPGRTYVELVDQQAPGDIFPG